MVGSSGNATSWFSDEKSDNSSSEKTEKTPSSKRLWSVCGKGWKYKKTFKAAMNIRKKTILEGLDTNLTIH